jgi:hypothetical protein
MIEPLTPVTNAVLVQLVDGKPVVSLMIKDEDHRLPLARLAREIALAFVPAPVAPTPYEDMR